MSWMSCSINESECERMSQPRMESITRRVPRCMNTEFSFSLAGENGSILEKAVLEVSEKIRAIECALTEYASSAVSDLNQAPPGVWCSVPEFLSEILSLSIQLEGATQGVFTAASKSKGPLAKRLLERFALRKVGAKITEICRLDSEAHLGFGAIGKGYALDVCALILERWGIQNYCLVAGGSSIRVQGFDFDSRGRMQPWKISWAVERSSETHAWLGTDLFWNSGQSVGIGVSGLQEQKNHLIDPRSGKMVEGQEHSLLSSWVSCRSAAVADALSTAVFVSGLSETLSQLDASDFRPAIAVVESDGRARWNGVFQRSWGAMAGVVSASVILGSASANESAPTDAEVVDLEAEEVNLNPEAGAGQVQVPQRSENFQPYQVTRNTAWVLLPIALLLLTLVHLKRARLGMRGSQGRKVKL
jgi:thiamine biosynthesis lipoprotein ApbE